MGVIERVSELVEPMLGHRGLRLYDIEHNAGVLRVTVENDVAPGATTDDGRGPGEVDLELLGDLTRELSRALDDSDPVPGRYTLEVSSPGLERRLRLGRHFVGAVGTEVTVKMSFPVDGQRRFDGVLDAVDDDTITVDGTTLAIADIAKARTVFRWGPTPKPGAARRGGPDNQRSHA